MVCIYCGHKTSVINSRSKSKNNVVWRRRRCLNCQSIFTTTEAVKRSESILVKSSDGKLHSFSRDKLFLSIYAVLNHRDRAVKEAGSLTDSALSRLTEYITSGVILSEDIKQIVQVILNRYDKAASVKYGS